GEAYGKIIAVDLLHKLHDERKYDGLDALIAGINQDCHDARAHLATHANNALTAMQTQRSTTLDRI
ncbi:MAG: riboflavin kinase, partial [Burkholderiaceae bacterium]